MAKPKITVTLSSAQAEALVKALLAVPKQTKTIEKLIELTEGAIGTYAAALVVTA